MVSFFINFEHCEKFTAHKNIQIEGFRCHNQTEISFLCHDKAPETDFMWLRLNELSDLVENI